MSTESSSIDLSHPTEPSQSPLEPAIDLSRELDPAGEVPNDDKDSNAPSGAAV